MHLNKRPHLFSIRRPTLTKKDPKQSIPVEWNAGLNNRSLGGGRLTIFCEAGFDLHLQHSRHIR